MPHKPQVPILPELPPHSHLAPQEIADFLHITLRTVYRLCGRGELPHVCWGSVIRIPREEFLRWYEKNKG